MGDLLPQERYVFAKQFAGDPVVKIWESREMNAKAKVVCENCNNGWMSDLESERAKPAMRDLLYRAVLFDSGQNGFTPSQYLRIKPP